MVTASADKMVGLWDAETGQTIGVLQGHAGAVVSAAFSAGWPARGDGVQ